MNPSSNAARRSRSSCAPFQLQSPPRKLTRVEASAMGRRNSRDPAARSWREDDGMLATDGQRDEGAYRMVPSRSRPQDRHCRPPNMPYGSAAVATASHTVGMAERASTSAQAQQEQSQSSAYEYVYKHRTSTIGTGRQTTQQPDAVGQRPPHQSKRKSLQSERAEDYGMGSYHGRHQTTILGGNSGYYRTDPGRHTAPATKNSMPASHRSSIPTARPPKQWEHVMRGYVASPWLSSSALRSQLQPRVAEGLHLPSHPHSSIRYSLSLHDECVERSEQGHHRKSPDEGWIVKSARHGKRQSVTPARTRSTSTSADRISASTSNRIIAMPTALCATSSTPHHLGSRAHGDDGARRSRFFAPTTKDSLSYTFQQPQPRGQQWIPPHEIVGDPALGVYRLKLPPSYTHLLDRIVAHSESYASMLEGGWKTELYSLTKQDLALMDIPGMRRLVQPIFSYILHAITVLYKTQKVYMDRNQPHILKYSVSTGHTGVELHHDRCDITANLVLSRKSSYRGGGTYIPEVGKVLRIEHGEFLLHPGDLVHGGMEITSGTRYLMVVFANLSEKRLREQQQPPQQSEE